MIISVFVTGCGDEQQWQAELLEYSWSRSGQSGELVRLIAAAPGAALPLHTRARVESTLPWANHPYIDDSYPGYDLPASLLQWLWRERLDATILLLDAESILLQPLEREVAPGEVVAHSWKNFPAGEGPFGLSGAYTDLQAYCVNRQLNLARMQLPLAIHSSDLLKIAPRWLELIGILRKMNAMQSEPPGNPLKVALAIVAAEYQLAVAVEDLSAHIIESDDGGRAFLDFCDKFENDRVTGEILGQLRPVRRPGVREARVLDQVYLELEEPGLKTLNTSAGAIWNLCDGQNTLREIAETLHARYEVPLEAMVADVLQGAKLLRSEGAIDLEGVN